jgi:hypothetical protein
MSIEKLREDARDKAAADKRRHLLARMAGNIAAVFCNTVVLRDGGARYVPRTDQEVAEKAVGVAEAILAELERRYPP